MNTYMNTSLHMLTHIPLLSGILLNVGVLEEAEFYNIPSLVTVLKERINVNDKKNPKVSLRHLIFIFV